MISRLFSPARWTHHVSLHHSTQSIWANSPETKDALASVVVDPLPAPDSLFCSGQDAQLCALKLHAAWCGTERHRERKNKQDTGNTLNYAQLTGRKTKLTHLLWNSIISWTNIMKNALFVVLKIYVHCTANTPICNRQKPLIVKASALQLPSKIQENY